MTLDPPAVGVAVVDDDRGWWLPILLGLLLVGLGVWMVLNPFESVIVLALLLAVSLITGGVVEVVALGGRRGLGWIAWLGGLVLVAAGIIVLAWPDVTLWVLAVLAGCGMLMAGLIEIASALLHRHDAEMGPNLVAGAFGSVLGIVVLAWPEATVVVLAVCFGLRAIVTGLVAIVAGWQAHRLAV